MPAMCLYILCTRMYMVQSINLISKEYSMAFHLPQNDQEVILTEQTISFIDFLEKVFHKFICKINPAVLKRGRVN